MKRGEFIFNTLVLPVDFFMLLVAGTMTYLLRTKILASFRPVLFSFDLPFERYILLVIVVSLVFIACYAAAGLYSLKATRGIFEELAKILVASAAGIMVLIVYIFLRQELFNSRFLILGACFFAIVFVSIGRLAMRQLQRFLITRHNFGTHKVMVIGEDRVSQKILHEIGTHPGLGYRIVKHSPHPSMEEIRLFIVNPGIDEIILANPNYPADDILQIVDFCHENHLTFKFVPNIYQTLTANFAVDTISGIPLIELRRTALAGWGHVAKRVLDIFFSVVALILLAPSFLVIAIAIKLDSRGPVFVHLDRISRNKKFGLLKFRSMVNGAEGLKSELMSLNERADSPLFKIKNDPRITRVGRFIRKTRIDEFPQFWNVLRGDISLVGPRPHQPDEIARYQKHHKRVLAIKAGATGLAQISGSSDLPFEEEVALDTTYIENWSMWSDLKIIVKTAVRIFNDHSAV